MPTVNICHKANKYNEETENLLQRSYKGYFSIADCPEHGKMGKNKNMQHLTLKTKAQRGKKILGK